ncbi:variant surface antigen rifin [Plasmodium falciparum IGH-CR14]|uniref:Variant surface antigen rifin n=1 Tax=Plasmodium falciparum IGH-CR14 TaxID=580059 RepID=A0A0L1I981_PLAFA|nr:variant surface antigen rifin [Plasmodium falciparum IGH-CR14]
MKIHYINILLFELPLNILVYNQRNHYITRTPKATTRTLCECELYAPSNYDNDPEMKAVMQQFGDRTSQRFHEYDERMKNTRQKCKEQCDKEIEKIILKDKIDKELTEKFATLQTDIQSDAIPTCVCEKSMVDKMEKNCMKCAQNLGGIVAPSSGVLAGIAEGALIVWKDAEIVAAIAAAKEAGAVAGKAAGDIAGAAEITKLIKSTFQVQNIADQPLVSYFTTTPFNKASIITKALFNDYAEICLPGGARPGGDLSKPICKLVMEQSLATSGSKSVKPIEFIGKEVETMVSKAEGIAEAKKTEMTSTMTATITAEKTGVINATYTSWQIAITASVIAIVVIVLIMVIIYLILRYRRKKKMKKKLQYIKLLEE